MKSLHSFLLVLALSLVHSLNISAQTLNDNGSTHTINANGSNLYQGSAQDFTIPTNSSYNSISFTLRGGDGGYAKAGADCQSNGGAGAIVTATFWIGPGQDDLNPGGTIRFIVGKRGTDSSVGGTSSCKGGGGGGSAVQYRPPNSSNWYILAVAGAGGGAYQGNIFGGCVDSQKGQGGQTTRWGGNGEGSGAGAGGDNGQGGAQGDTGKGGGGAITAGGGEGGGAGGDEGGEGSNPPSPGNPGGWGYGGGGGGGEGGSGGAPGGGGYSGGGGGGVADNGGGGGSYVNPTRSFNSSKTEGEKGGGNSQNGYISYSFINTVITWTGAVDHDWHNSGNWSPARVPGSNDIVEINAAANDPYIWTTADARSVKVFSGGELTIQPNATLNLSPTNGFSGIFNFGTVTNDNGILNISSTGNSTVDGILNSGSTFTNKFGGTINIEGMDRHGIFNNSNSTFTNQLGGTINIGTVSDPIGENGIQNEAGCTFSNFGALNIKKANLIGIQNAGSFSNYLGGLIDLKNAGTRGIHCEANTFTNNGGINIGNGDTIGQDGIYLNSSASFINNTSGTVLIWGTGNLGILVEDNGTIDNFGTISIGGLGGTGTLGVAAIGNLGFLNNKPGGAISINQTTNAGILNGSTGLLGEFDNEGDITIGATSGTGDDAIQNQGNFDNFSTGTIDIVQSGRNGLRNTGNGSFTNEGLIKIGENGSITDAAIRNEAPFLNNSCSAVIHLFEKNIADTHNSFTNSGTILKESTGSSNIETNNGVILYNAGTFTADNGNAPVSVTGSFSGKKIWTGCTDNDWATAENWTPNGVPTASDDVVIYPVATDPLIITSVQTKSVQVAGGHLINNGALAVTDGDLDINLGSTVGGNGQYDISGHFTVNGGTFIPGTSTVTMTGTIDDRAIGFDPITFYNLVLDKPADKAVRIFANVSVTNEMIINSGDLEVVGVVGGSLICPYLHLPNGTDLFNFDGGNIFVTQSGNSFLIQSGASVQGNGVYYIAGNFKVDGGTFTPGTSAVILNGTGNQTISFDSTNFYTLIINKLSGITSLGDGSVTVSNLLNLNHGKLNLNGSDIELIGNGTITGENTLNYIYSTNGGVVTKTVDLNAPAAENPGNIGASITSSANLGTTTIQRGHDVQDVNGEVSIKRYYDIAPANNSGLDATVRFSYLDHELNGIAEPVLRPYRFNGTDWNIYLASASDVSANWVETQNVDAFSTWTLAADCGATTLYADVDGDGYGDPTVTIFDCLGLSGYVADNTDCDDSDATIFPGAPEICDGIDNDCDGLEDSNDPNFVDNTPPVPEAPDCTNPIAAYAPAATSRVLVNDFTFPAQVITPTESSSEFVILLELNTCKANGLAGAQLDIVSVTSGEPNWTDVLGTAIVPAAEIYGLPGCQAGTFGTSVFSYSGVSLQAGVQYALVLKLAPGSVGDIGWRRSLTPTDPSNPYSGGKHWSFDMFLGIVESFPDADLQFEVLACTGLPTVTGECSATLTPPTATDNCTGTVTGTTTDPTSYTEQGTYTVTWTYDDGNGNTSSQVQTVIIAKNQVTCYLDSDNDTYGDPAMAQTFCETCGTGYVLDNTDCDDGDANEYPGQGWYSDLDNDGYTGNSVLVGCERPDGYKLASELVNTTDVDCNDNDPAVFMLQAWYEDQDDDDYTTGITQLSCNRPNGYKLASELVNTTDIDCDDSDPNVNSCSGLTISGSIIWEHDGVSGVNNATINVTGAGSGSDVSDTNGDYEVNIPSGTGNFTVKPVKNINKLNGLTSADVTAIQQHVTFIELLPAPFKRIAADVNKSNTITTMDATLVNQALLGNPAAMNQIKSWRFVSDTYVFPNPNVPWGFPEQINLTGITSNTSGHDFKGIKLGDVVSTWANPANFGAGEPMVLRVQDQVLQAGQEVSIDFHVDQLADLNSFQFALYFDPAQLALLEIEPLGGLPISMGNFGTFNIDGGELRVVWAQANPVMLTEAAQLFRLRFEALETGALLRNVLRLNEDALPAYAYNSAYAESGVQLRFVETSATTDPDEAVLRLEAWPNPFSESTVLQFSLPQAGEAEIRVHDLTGQVIFSKKAYYAAGAHNERLDLAGNATGMYMVELRSAAGRAVLPLVRADK